jgi:hypothetical protein
MMKLPAKSVAWLLPLFLTACIHKADQAQVQAPLAPPIEDAPPPKPAPAPTDLPPPVITVPGQTTTPTPSDTTQATPTPPPPKHKKKTAPDQAANTDSGVSAIGQLSTGDPSDIRKQTEDSMAATERGLNGITRGLTDQEKKTATQIREFLRQAREALNSGDVDGAHTLAAKAKVLLGELNK